MNANTTEVASSPAALRTPHVPIKRMDFFIDEIAYEYFVKAKAFQQAWSICAQRKVPHLVLNEIRYWMRASACDAVRRARKKATADAATKASWAAIAAA